ncbi:YhgE/Pip domain-containing protein [Alkalihalobacillus sp. 1P02AB]|uniref:YhgE/Pip domain-containing protein n=1 Tax=Alkalihalobacillus sp. 1P02AB TaxID=3132260 RepID=UPI0039A6916B
MRKKRWIALTLAMLFIMPSFFVNAASSSSSKDEQQTSGEMASKDEVVYANLQASGEVHNVYVVNYLNVTKAGIVEDYGSYSDVTNLTDLSKITQERDKLVIDAPEGPFYYQGNMGEQVELPWKFLLTYKIDGKDIEPEELVGKDGLVEIIIETKANAQVDPAFFENYLLQITLNLSEEKFQNIKAPDATIANAGKNKQVTFTVMPEKEAELTVQADVLDFEFEGVEIAAVPSSMSIDLPDTQEMTGDISTLSSAIGELHDGVGELKDGVNELSNGMVQLSDGSKEFKGGMSEVAKGGGELVAASELMNEALKTISQSVNGDMDELALDDWQALEEGLAEISTGLEEVSEGLLVLSEHYTIAYNTLDDTMNAIPQAEITEEEIALLYRSDADKEIIQKLIDSYSAAQTAKGTYLAVKEGFDAVAPTLQEVSSGTNEMGTHLKLIAEGLSSSLENVDIADAMQQLKIGLTEVATHYGELHSGISSYTKGIRQLSNSYDELHSGNVQLASGTKDLESGVNELHDGTGELYDATDDMPEQMQAEIDKMMSEFDKSDFEAISFVSEQNNEQIHAVQFVIKTESIKHYEVESSQEETEEEQGFWKRLLKLFGIGV